MNPFAQNLESVLFYLAEPVTVSDLAHMLKSDERAVRAAIEEIESALLSHGLRILRNGETVCLVTAPESSEVIQRIVKEEMERDLSKASLETLSIVLYKGPVTRSEIDHIRGVNSTFILRNLLVRGLIEKVDNPSDQRSYLYRPTNALLEKLGVTSVETLPRYEESLSILEKFANTSSEETQVPASDSPKETTEMINDSELDITEDVELANDQYEDKQFSEIHRHEQ